MAGTLKLSSPFKTHPVYMLLPPQQEGAVPILDLRPSLAPGFVSSFRAALSQQTQHPAPEPA